jgi:hypothetical protein
MGKVEEAESTNGASDRGYGRRETSLRMEALARARSGARGFVRRGATTGSEVARNRGSRWRCQMHPSEEGKRGRCPTSGATWREGWK